MPIMYNREFSLTTVNGKTTYNLVVQACHSHVYFNFYICHFRVINYMPMGYTYVMDGRTDGGAEGRMEDLR